MITNEELTAMQEVIDAATPGPWTSNLANRGNIIRNGETNVLYIYSGTDDSGHAIIRIKDIDLITNARTDWPRCITALEEAYEENAALHARVAELENEFTET